MKKEITQTKEDYLRAIFYLAQKKGEVKAKDLLPYLKLNKSTVSERLQELVKQKLITYRESIISLTAKGTKIAQTLTYKHRIIEVFLHQMLQMPIESVHEEAHKLEHAFSDDVIARLADVLGNPQKDPHGRPIISNDEQRTTDG